MNVVEALSLARHNYQFSWIHGNALVINNHPIHESGPPRQPSDFAGRRVFARSSLIAVDPVCVVHVDEKAGVPAEQYTSQYEGETPYFSLLNCEETFDGDREQYRSNSLSQRQAVNEFRARSTARASPAGNKSQVLCENVQDIANIIQSVVQMK